MVKLAHDIYDTYKMTAENADDSVAQLVINIH